MGLKFTCYDADEGGCGWVEGLDKKPLALYDCTGTRTFYHIAQVTPLIQEVTVYIDTVGLGKVFGDQLADGGEVQFFACCFVLDILKLRYRYGLGHFWLSHSEQASQHMKSTHASDAVVPSVGMWMNAEHSRLGKACPLILVSIICHAVTSLKFVRKAAGLLVTGTKKHCTTYTNIPTASISSYRCRFYAVASVAPVIIMIRR